MLREQDRNGMVRSMTQLRIEKESLPEAFVGQHIKRLRLENGWSLEELAEDLTKQGCPMNKGSLSRIERGAQGVRLNEAWAISRLTGVPLLDLLDPPEVVDRKYIREAFDGWLAADKIAEEARAAAAAALDRLAAIVKELPTHDAIRERVAEWITSNVELANTPGAVDYWLLILTEDEQYREGAEALLLRDLQRIVTASRVAGGSDG